MDILYFLTSVKIERDMRNSLLKVLGTVKLIQEVTRSSTQSSLNFESTSTRDEEPTIVNNNHNKTTPNLTKSQNNLITSDQLKTQQQLSCWSATQPIPITFSTFNTPNILLPRDIKTLFTTNTSTRKSNNHTRRNSKYAVRHYRHYPSRRLLTITNNNNNNINNINNTRPPQQHKSKSHKLLCLWPLPIFTQYIILTSLLVSTLNALNILHTSFSAPSYVIYRLNLIDLFLSPFLFHFTLPSIALFSWNVLILGLFEESLTHLVGGTKRFTTLFVSLFLTLLGLRNLLGFLFSKSTGWALPILFFSNSMHERSEGNTHNQSLASRISKIHRYITLSLCFACCSIALYRRQIHSYIWPRGFQSSTDNS